MGVSGRAGGMMLIAGINQSDQRAGISERHGRSGSGLPLTGSFP